MILNSTYQFVGRSNAVFNYGSAYYYYLLLYAKTEAITATGKHKVSLKLRMACQVGDGFYGYSTTGYGKVAGAAAVSWTSQLVPNGSWTAADLTEGGVTYKRWVDLKEGSTEVAVGYGSAKDVALEASFQRLDMASPPAWVPQTTPMKLSATVTLPAIAGASVPTVSASSVAMGGKVTITTNRKSASFTHTLTYAFGSASGTIATGVGASYAWTVPDLVAKLPNATSGTCTITCKTFSGTKEVGAATCTLTLTVPAASVPTVSAGSVEMGGKVTITTNRKSASFTHTLTYAFGSASGTIATNVGASCSWTPPLELAKQIPNALSGSATITCTTYNGTKQVGAAQSVQLTLRVPETAATKPGLTMTLSPDSALTGVFAGLYIQNLTKLKVQTAATGQYGATVKATALTVSGRPYGGSVLYDAGQIPVVAKVTDSRGFTNSVSQSITVLPYSKPAIVPAAGYSDIICARCDEKGSFTDSGTSLRIIAKRSYSTVTANGVQKNFCAIRYRIGSGSWVTVLPKTAAADTVDTGALVGKVPLLTSAYTVYVGVVDDMGNTATVTKVVPTDRVDVHLRQGGGGIAFGGYSKKPGFDCSMEARFLDSDLALQDYVVEQGTADGWQYRKWNSGIAECWCSTSFTVSTAFAESATGGYFCGSSDTVTFPTGLFKATPNVVYSHHSNAYLQSGIKEVSTYGVSFLCVSQWALTDTGILCWLQARGNWK